VAVIDPVQSVRATDLNGIQLFEWGLHDRNFEIASDPPELLDELRSRYGDHPVRSCDLHGRARSGYERLLDDLIQGVELKTAFLLELLRRENWDLFVATYGETHCVGHQFWHFLDPDHQWHDPAAPVKLRYAIRAVYQAIDKGIGELIEAAGRDALVLVVASHGMGLYTGGPQLLPELLVRLGFGSSNGNASSWLRRLQTKVSHAPRTIQPFLTGLARAGFMKGIQARSACLLDPLESPLTRAVALRNNRCGAIRLNLKGREPVGRVGPGYEAESLMAELREELFALKDPTSGQPIVTEVTTATEVFGPEHHLDVPDLMVVFRSDLGPIEACYSPRVGLVEVPIFHPNIPRSGDHTPESRLWTFGRGIAQGGRLPVATVLDIAPTVLRLLDVPVPATRDGWPLPVVGRAWGVRTSRDLAVFPR
jgi:predicted AlkP superfamily phosphohydrolase/phosphomutase